MAKSPQPKGTLIIAGPGAGKTHNMVNAIMDALPVLSSCRTLAVITYTNSATNNIRNRLAKRINIPPNLFIGTIHAFLNKFVVIPFASFVHTGIPAQKMFMQFGSDNAFDFLEKQKPSASRLKDFRAIATVKSRVKESMTRSGYITFDQTLAIAESVIADDEVCSILSNRLQFLFVDEFQDSCNKVFAVIENLRKKGKTKIYCVGDPEQYIQSFDSTIRSITNIPILKAANSIAYDVQINYDNYRCTGGIVKFLNQFNGRNFSVGKFEQQPKAKDGTTEIEEGGNVVFIAGLNDVTPILARFAWLCDVANIPVNERCVLAKGNKEMNRIAAAVNHHYKNPKKDTNAFSLKATIDTLLCSLDLNQKQFCELHACTLHELRKAAVSIFRAIQNGTINNENTYGKFVAEQLGYGIKKAIPIKIENLNNINETGLGLAMTVSNIHTIKGLESKAVLAIAKDEAELLKWLETDHPKRDADKEDVPRIGYVAFSRAEKLLCIACLTPITKATRELLSNLKLDIHSPVKLKE